MGKGGIPDRWEAYSNMGRQIPGTRFFAFKVPLKDALLRNLPPSVDPFGPRELMDHCTALGLVIDLTNTNRYYDPQVFQDQNIQYEKLNTEGHVVPKTKVIQEFFKIVEKFSEENAGNDKLIGVHCTHGINRTGYLICRYLIQQLGVPPDQAISDFNSARGHDQERENYLKDLRTTSWLRSSDHFKMGRNRWSDNTKANEGFTPPYMPHQSRRIMRSRSSGSPANTSRGRDDLSYDPRRGCRAINHSGSVSRNFRSEEVLTDFQDLHLMDIGGADLSHQARNMAGAPTAERGYSRWEHRPHHRHEVARGVPPQRMNLRQRWNPSNRRNSGRCTMSNTTRGRCYLNTISTSIIEAEVVSVPTDPNPDTFLQSKGAEIVLERIRVPDPIDHPQTRSNTITILPKLQMREIEEGGLRKDQ